jgi:hypothetical protein
VRRASLAVAASLALAGCALLAPPQAAPPFRDPAVSMTAAREAIALGTSTKADIQARLGPAEVVRFDSGWEVWAYRDKRAREPAAWSELVVLFSPSGLAQKVRVRPAEGSAARR